MYTRRQFGKLALASVPLASAASSLVTSAASAAAAVPAPLGKVAKDASKFNGVQIGVQTYSYRALRDTKTPWSVDWQKKQVDLIVDCMVQDQINSAEFWIGFIEPFGGGAGRGADPAAAQAAAQQQRERLRAWRTSHPTEIMEYARKQFGDAGIEIHTCMYNFDDAIMDDEMDAAFEMAKALGTNIVTANCTPRSIKRAAPFAAKHKMFLAAHSENAPFDPDIDGMVFADNLLMAAGLNDYMRLTLDIGHFWAYGGDPVSFIRQHHAKIVNLHLKDRLKNHPEFHNDTNDLAFGKADTPIKEVLQLMRKEKYAFPATIEYEYKSDKTCIEAVRDALNYCKGALS